MGADQPLAPIHNPRSGAVSLGHFGRSSSTWRRHSLRSTDVRMKKSSSHWTRRWGEMDSNYRSPVRWAGDFRRAPAEIAVFEVAGMAVALQRGTLPPARARGNKMADSSVREGLAEPRR